MKFYGSIEGLRAHPPSYADPFILQWEIPQPRDGVERKYVVFDGIDEYMRYLSNNRYNTCHEVFLSQGYNPHDDLYAHPAFDIDIKSEFDVESDWVELLQQDIITVLIQQYPALKDQILRIRSHDIWIWMSSPSPDKISKHLVISKVCFSMWRVQMKLLVDSLLKLERKYIKGIDAGILRKLGSLRLPLNHKRHIYGDSGIEKYSPTLQFDNTSHRFTDGIVILHDANMYTMTEGLVLTPSDLSPEHQAILSHSYGVYNIPGSSPSEDDDLDDVNSDELTAAFNRWDKLYNTGLCIGKISGNYLSLIRKAPGKCPISGKEHTSDNAYIIKRGYKILYGCHRGCVLKTDGIERKCIDITPWKGNAAEDNARIIHESMKEQ